MVKTGWVTDFVVGDSTERVARFNSTVADGE